MYNNLSPKLSQEMAIITSIKQQKKKDRVNVYVDDEFKFGIDLDNFVLLGLRVGQNLDSKEIEEIVKKAEFQKVLDKLLKFATLRPRSEKEIRDYLSRKKVSHVIHKDLFSRLKDFGFLNDMEFAEWWVEARNSFRPKSKLVIKGELRGKGIDKDIIDKVLNEIKIDERKIAMDLLIKRENHWENIDKPKRKQKMLQYLVQKGFGFDIAKSAVEGYNMREDDRVK